MSRRLRPTYSGITSTIALVVALSGGAYAAAALPRNSVGTRQIQSGAVTSPKVAGNAVTSAKVANRSLKGNDLAPNTVTLENLSRSVQSKFSTPGIRYQWSNTVTPGSTLNTLMTIPAGSLIVADSISSSLAASATCTDERITITAVPVPLPSGVTDDTDYGDPLAVEDVSTGIVRTVGIAHTAHTTGSELSASLTCLSGSGMTNVDFDLAFSVYTMASEAKVHGFG